MAYVFTFGLLGSHYIAIKPKKVSSFLVGVTEQPIVIVFTTSPLLKSSRGSRFFVGLTKNIGSRPFLVGTHCTEVSCVGALAQLRQHFPDPSRQSESALGLQAYKHQAGEKVHHPGPPKKSSIQILPTLGWGPKVYKQDLLRFVCTRI